MDSLSLLYKTNTFLIKVIIIVICLLLANTVSGKSLKPSFESENSPQNGKWSAGSGVNSHTVITLSSDNPQKVWEMKENLGTFPFDIAQNSSVFRLAVHLKSCNYSDDEYIQLEYVNSEDVTSKLEWKCAQDGIHLRHIGDRFQNVPEVIDDLRRVNITPKFKGKGKDKKLKATLVISLYMDMHGECGNEYFNCYTSLCPTICCSEQQALRGKRQQDVNEVSTSSPLTSPISFPQLWQKRSSTFSRCIPKQLMCNDEPNCGSYVNADEKNEVCHPEQYCPCQSMCLTWNHILTSIAIAVLFIITPTAIVFALFHRRNVALERARLLRLAQARMADLRGQFTMDPPPNDHPPTYDEVCDTKEPPPCFCQAIAMEKALYLQEQHDALQESINNRQRDGEAVEENVEISENVAHDAVTSDSDGGIGVQNLGFHCSCQDLRNANEIDESEQSQQGSDFPPNYSDVKVARNNGSRRSSNVSSEEQPPDYVQK